MVTLEARGFAHNDYALPIITGPSFPNIEDERGVHWHFVTALTLHYHRQLPHGGPLTRDFTINGTAVRKIVLIKREHISGSNVYNFVNGRDNFHIKITFQSSQNTLKIESEGLPREVIGVVEAYHISDEIAGRNYINIV